MKLNLVMLLVATLSISHFAIAKEPKYLIRGLLDVLPVLAKYPGYLLSVEAEGNNKGEFFYEFDVFMKDRSNPKNSKEVEVECNPKTVELTDAEKRSMLPMRDLKSLVNYPKSGGKNCIRQYFWENSDREYYH